MLDNLPILSLITFSPLLGLLILLFVPKDKGRVIKVIGILTALIPLILAGMLYADYDRSSDETMQYTEEQTWISAPLQSDGAGLAQLNDLTLELGYKMSVDGLSVAMIFLTALVGLMAAMAAVHIKKRWKTFYILFLLLLVGMLGVFSARDLFLFFVFFEITLVATFFLIGIWGFKGREKASMKFLIYNGIGSAFMLIAFLVLVVTAGFTTTVNVEENSISAYYTADVDQITENMHAEDSYANLDDSAMPNNPFKLTDNLQWFVFILILLAFGIKLPIFPFHTWMLKVHAEAPPAVVMIHSGILLKMGGYGLIRFGVGFFPDKVYEWGLFLAILGAINIIYGAILAFRQTDIRLVLAYSSVSHMGIVLFGIAALNTIGLEGAIFQMVSHGLISALLFLLVGSIYERTNTFELREMGGLAKSVPFMSGLLLAAGMASLGLPGMSGFISEFMAFVGLFDTMPVITIIGTIGIILAAVYVLRAILRMTYGPTPSALEGIQDARLVEAVPMIALLAFIVLIGVYPSVLSDPLKHSIDLIVQNIAGKIGG